MCCTCALKYENGINLLTVDEQVDEWENNYEYPGKTFVKDEADDLNENEVKR